MNGGDEVVAAPVDPPQPLEWKFSQVFGERTAGEEVQEGIYKYIYCIMFSIFFFGNVTNLWELLLFVPVFGSK